MAHRIQDYLAEQFSYGGVIMPRAAIIHDMQRIGGTQRQIDAWFIGSEVGRRARAKAEDKT